MLSPAIWFLCCFLWPIAHSIAAHDSPNNYFDLAVRMIESNVGRGQGLLSTNKSSTFIEQAIFQQSLRAALELSRSDSETIRWKHYLSQSTQSLAPSLLDAAHDAQLPLDRFSAGTGLILEYNTSGTSSLLQSVQGLRESALLQPRNADGGFWYYDLISNIPGYQNVSYLDGMYSYPAFAALSERSTEKPPGGWIVDAFHQLQILYERCVQDSGLLVHGYDARKAHPWADPTTGASPIVWGRALAWYTVGLITMSEQNVSEQSRLKIRALFQKVVVPQLRAYEASLSKTSKPGVWQVVDRPGDRLNFVEASASFLTAYSLLTGVRLGLLDRSLHDCAVQAGSDIYKYASETFLIRNDNGTLGIDGTSPVASLGSGTNISYEYYVTRPTELNSLFGTSGFILASLEMSRLDYQVENLARYEHGN